MSQDLREFVRPLLEAMRLKSDRFVAIVAGETLDGYVHQTSMSKARHMSPAAIGIMLGGLSYEAERLANQVAESWPDTSSLLQFEAAYAHHLQELRAGRGADVRAVLSLQPASEKGGEQS